jgi:hypothetical protein
LVTWSIRARISSAFWARADPATISTTAHPRKILRIVVPRLQIVALGDGRFFPHRQKTAR